jgi:cyclin-dependent kinase 7
MSLSSKYLKGVQLGEGTWGTVFEAERRSDSLRVAIKRIKSMFTHLGVNFTALREIKYLKFVRGPNIIDVSGGWTIRSSQNATHSMY